MRKRTLGHRYRLIEEIGSGGMGTVYRARDTRTGNTVAVKILHPHLARDAEYLERFRREIEITRSLDSPNIIRVLDFGEDGTDRFLVMDYVEGVSLRQLLDRRGAIPESEALRIASQVATALGEAHTKGVIHRDVKPANILIARDGTARVADFGIARAQDYSALTMTGALAGSVQYMAPELLKESADARSDIYSLGIVLFEMVAGEPPFSAPTPWRVLQHQRETRLPDLRERDPAPASVELIERCLEKSPEQRFQSAAEVGDALNSLAVAQALEQGADVNAVRPALRSASVRSPMMRIPGRGAHNAKSSWDLGKPAARVGTFRVRSRTALLGGTLLAIVVALAASGGLWLGRGAGQPPTSAVDDSRTPEASTIAYVDRQSLPSSIAYPYQVNKGDTVASLAASRSVSEDTIVEANDTLATPRPLVAGETIQIPIPGAIHVQSVVHVDWPEDPSDHTTPLGDFTLYGSIDTPAWSPLGDELAACGVVPDDPLHPRQIAILSRSGVNRPLALRQIECSSVNWAPDGARLVFDSPTSGGSDLYITDRVGGAPTNLTKSAEDGNHGAAWSPDGRFIAFVKDRDCSVYVMHADGSPMYDYRDPLHPAVLPMTRLAPASATDDGPSWSPDGKTVAFFAAAGTAASESQCSAATSPVANALVAVDLASQKLSVIEQAANAVPGSAPRWSPDGRYIAYWSAAMSTDQATANLTMAAVDGSGGRPLVQASHADGLSWSPDGARMVFAADVDGSHGLFTTEVGVDAPRARLSPVPLGDQSGSPSWSPQLPVPYVALRSLIGRGASLERLVYSNMNVSTHGQIVVQSSLHVDSCQVSGSALPPIQFVDVFGFDERGGQWVKIFDGSQGKSPLIPSTCGGYVNTVDVQVARPDGSGNTLAITVGGGANRQTYDFFVVGMVGDVPTVLYQQRNEIEFTARAEGNRITMHRAYYGKHDALCCPSAVAEQVLTISGDHQLTEGEPAFTPSCVEGSVDYPNAVTDGSAIAVSCGSLNSGSQSVYTIDLTTNIHDAQGRGIPGVTDQRQIPKGSKVRVENYRADDNLGLVAQQLTIMALP